jgi:hypothetical protein
LIGGKKSPQPVKTGNVKTPAITAHRRALPHRLIPSGLFLPVFCNYRGLIFSLRLIQSAFLYNLRNVFIETPAPP